MQFYLHCLSLPHYTRWPMKAEGWFISFTTVAHVSRTNTGKTCMFSQYFMYCQINKLMKEHMLKR